MYLKFLLEDFIAVDWRGYKKKYVDDIFLNDKHQINYHDNAKHYKL